MGISNDVRQCGQSICSPAADRFHEDALTAFGHSNLISFMEDWGAPEVSFVRLVQTRSIANRSAKGTISSETSAHANPSACLRIDRRCSSQMSRLRRAAQSPNVCHDESISAVLTFSPASLCFSVQPGR
jgi:hypothetical protein